MKLLSTRRLWILLVVMTGLFLSTMACNFTFDAVSQAQYLDVEWSPTSEIFAVGGTEGLQVFDSQLKQIYAIEGEWVSDVAWNPSGSVLAVATETSHLSFIRVDSTNLTEVQQISLPGLQHVAWNSDGTMLGITIMDSFGQYSLRIYEVGDSDSEHRFTISELYSFSDYNKQITSLAWDSSGRYLAVVDRNPIVRIVDSVNGVVIATVDYTGEDSTTYVGEVTIEWHPVNTLLGIQQRTQPIDTLSIQGDVQTSDVSFLGTDFVWSDNGEHVAVAADENIKVSDLETGNVEQTLEEIDGYIEHIALQPAGNLMAGVGSISGGRLQIWLWNVDSGQIVATLK